MGLEGRSELGSGKKSNINHHHIPNATYVLFGHLAGVWLAVVLVLVVKLKLVCPDPSRGSCGEEASESR